MTHSEYNLEEMKENHSYNLFVLLLVIIIGILGFSALSLKFWPYTMDDAYITFRYAQNFASGNGLVFNVGEKPRAEGITSPLYAIILSLSPKNIDIVTFSKWLGLLSAFFSSILVGVIVFKVSTRFAILPYYSHLILSATAATYCLTNPYIVGNAVSGMETSISGLAFLTFIMCIINVYIEEKVKNSLLFFTGLVATTVPLLRPEMALVVLATLITFSLINSNKRKHMSIILLIFIGLGTLYFITRYIYYEMLLPLPFYIKQGGVKEARGLYGRLELLEYIQHTYILILGIFIYLALLFAPTRKNNYLLRKLLIVLLFAITLQLIYYSTIHHIMGFGLRYFQPISFGIITLGFISFGCIYSLLNLNPIRNHISLPLLFMGIYCILLFINEESYWKVKPALVDCYAKSFSDRGIKNWKPVTQAAMQVKNLQVAMYDCGQFPFLTGFRTIDLAGLNNRAIALGRSKETTIDEIKKNNPSLVILVGDKNNPKSTFGWESVFSSDLFKLGYSYKGVIKFGKNCDKSNYYWLCYINNDPNADLFLSALAKAEIFEYWTESLVESDENGKRSD